MYNNRERIPHLGELEKPNYFRQRQSEPNILFWKCLQENVKLFAFWRKHKKSI